MEEPVPLWPMPWVRAALELAILSTLQTTDLHGYAIAAKLEAVGMGRLKGGSLYPALAKLEQAGHIEAVWQPGASGPGRKAYSLTRAGRGERQRLANSWQALAETLTTLDQPRQIGESDDPPC